MVKPLPAIYAITNRLDGKVYIGKTSHARRRRNQYVSAFKKPTSKYVNSYLRRAITKYGRENFHFAVLEYLQLDELADAELQWMLRFRSYDRAFGYNLRLDSGGACEFTSDAKRNLSAAARAQWADPIKRQNTIAGLRSGWINEDRKKQHRERCRTQFRRNTYWVFSPDGGVIGVDRNGLRERHLLSVEAQFSLEGRDAVAHKGHWIVRVRSHG